MPSLRPLQFSVRQRCARLVLVLGALGASVGCGEDVLVARFGLTSNAPDAGVVEAAASDAGEVNGQSINAERARAQALHDDSHPAPPPPPPPHPEPDKSH